MAYVRTSGADPLEAAALGLLYCGSLQSQVLRLYIPYRFYFIAEGLFHVVRGECWGGAGRILLPAAALASLGLEEAVAGSDVIMGLRDHGYVQFFLREWWLARCSSSFRRVGGLCPALFLTMSFAGLVAFARIRTLSSQCHFQGWWPLPVSALFFFCLVFCQAGRRRWRVGW